MCNFVRISSPTCFIIKIPFSCRMFFPIINVIFMIGFFQFQLGGDWHFLANLEFFLFSIFFRTYSFMFIIILFSNLIWCILILIIIMTSPWMRIVFIFIIIRFIEIILMVFSLFLLIIGLIVTLIITPFFLIIQVYIRPKFILIRVMSILILYLIMVSGFFMIKILFIFIIILIVLFHLFIFRDNMSWMGGIKFRILSVDFF